MIVWNTFYVTYFVSSVASKGIGFEFVKTCHTDKSVDFVFLGKCLGDVGIVVSSSKDIHG